MKVSRKEEDGKRRDRKAALPPQTPKCRKLKTGTYRRSVRPTEAGGSKRKTVGTVSKKIGRSRSQGNRKPRRLTPVVGGRVKARLGRTARTTSGQRPVVMQSKHCQTELSGFCFSCTCCDSVLEKLLHCCWLQEHHDHKSAMNPSLKGKNDISVPAVIQGHLFLPAYSSAFLPSSGSVSKPFSCDHAACLAVVSAGEFEVACSFPKLYVQCCTLSPNVEGTESLSLTDGQSCCDVQLVASSTGSSSWEPLGVSEKRSVFVSNVSPPMICDCFAAVRHKHEDEVVKKSDCIIVCSLNNKNSNHPDLAKVVDFYISPTNGSLMASVVWFYWLEQTRIKGVQCDSKEVFASKHFDAIPVECIQECVCVLTLNEYNRYIAENRQERTWPPIPEFFPRATLNYPRRGLMPREDTPESVVFFCRRVYDINRKRLLKNPN